MEDEPLASYTFDASKLVLDKKAKNCQISSITFTYDSSGRLMATTAVSPLPDFYTSSELPVEARLGQPHCTMYEFGPPGN